MFEVFSWEEWTKDKRDWLDYFKFKKWVPTTVLRFDCGFNLKLYELVSQSANKYYCNGVSVIAFENSNDATLLKLRYNG